MNSEFRKKLEEICIEKGFDIIDTGHKVVERNKVEF